MDVVRKADILRLARIHHVFDGDDLQEAGIRIAILGRVLIDHAPIYVENLTGDILRLAPRIDRTHNQCPGSDAQALDFIDEKATVLLVGYHVVAHTDLELGAASTVVAGLRAVGAAALRCSVALLTGAKLRSSPRIRILLNVLLERRTTATIVTRLVAMTASNCSAVTHSLTFSASLIFYNHYIKVGRESQAFLLCDFKDLQNTL